MPRPTMLSRLTVNCVLVLVAASAPAVQAGVSCSEWDAQGRVHNALLTDTQSLSVGAPARNYTRTEVTTVLDALASAMVTRGYASATDAATAKAAVLQELESVSAFDGALGTSEMLPMEVVLRRLLARRVEEGAVSAELARPVVASLNKLQRRMYWLDRELLPLSDPLHASQQDMDAFAEEVVNAVPALMYEDIAGGSWSGADASLANSTVDLFGHSTGLWLSGQMPTTHGDIAGDIADGITVAVADVVGGIGFGLKNPLISYLVGTLGGAFASLVVGDCIYNYDCDIFDPPRDPDPPIKEDPCETCGDNFSALTCCEVYFCADYCDNGELPCAPNCPPGL